MMHTERQDSDVCSNISLTTGFQIEKRKPKCGRTGPGEGERVAGVYVCGTDHIQGGAHRAILHHTKYTQTTMHIAELWSVINIYESKKEAQ